MLRASAVRSTPSAGTSSSAPTSATERPAIAVTRRPARSTYGPASRADTSESPGASETIRPTSRSPPASSPSTNSGSTLMLVDRLPAIPCDRVRRTGLQPARGLVGVRALAVEAPGLGVRDDLGDGVGGILLVGPDHATRPPLDPPDRILAAMRHALLVADAAAVVADQAAR